MDKLKDILRCSGTLSEEQTYLLFESFLSERNETISDEEILAFLESSSRRLPVVDELVGAARSLRKHMTPVEVDFPHLIDTCGTGGSGLSSFNASTAAALVCVTGGAKVAKHGNRSISSRCGSADVLEALGVKISHSRESAKEALEKTGFAFLFAPLFHPATKRVQTLRKKIGKRTIFNFLGPLCNPASIRRQLLGVSDRSMVGVIAKALTRLGADHALVVCGENGLDEVSLSGKTFVAEVSAGAIKEYHVFPEDFGFHSVALSECAGDIPENAARLLSELLAGKNDARSDFVKLNAGAALYVAGISSSWEEGVKKAEGILSSGASLATLHKIKSFT